jgi:hypothetical protein
MRFGKVSLAVATALSVASAPVLAQATNPAPVRAAAEVEDASELNGGFIIPLLALAAVILGILVLIKDEDDLPSSP